MNVLISVDENYLPKAETMLFSLRKNAHEDITVYLLSSLSKEKIDKFAQNLLKIKAKLHAINMSEKQFLSFPIGFNFSIEMYYRVLAQFVLPDSIDRILYLDADIVVINDITDFYHQELDKFYAVCRDVDFQSPKIMSHKNEIGVAAESDYFNSGVLLMNLKKLRAETNYENIICTANQLKEKILFPDQDILNFIYQGEVHYCESKYNYQIRLYADIKRIKANDICIIHYIGGLKPWSIDAEKNINAKWYWSARLGQGAFLDWLRFWEKQIKCMIIKVLKTMISAVKKLIKKIAGDRIYQKGKSFLRRL